MLVIEAMKMENEILAPRDCTVKQLLVSAGRPRPRAARRWPSSAERGLASGRYLNMELFLDLFSNVMNFTWQQILMIVIGMVLVYLAIKKEMEPSLLLPMGFGAVLVNLPFVNTEAIETLH